MTSDRLRQRSELFWVSPVAAAMERGAHSALRERLMEACTYAELSGEDRTLLREGVLAVSAIGAPHLGFGASGDFAAIDAGLDALEDEGDDAALEAALDAVGPGEYGYGDPPLSDEWEPSA